MVQKKLPLINSAHGSETRNIINELIKLFNGMGYTYDEALQKAQNVLKEAKNTNNMNKDVQKQINDLILSDGESDAEVIQARGNHDVLNERLNSQENRIQNNDFNMNRSLISNVSKRTPMISIIDDDGRADVLDKWQPLLDTKNFNLDIAVITSFVGKTNYLTWDELEGLKKNYNVDLVNHTNSHPWLGNLQTEEEIETEFKTSTDILKSRGHSYDIMVYPYGSDSVKVREIARKYCRAGFNIMGGVNTPPLSTYRINRQSLVPSSGEMGNLESYTQYIDEAIEQNGWIVFMTHSWYEGFDSDKIGELIDYANSKNMKWVSAKEGLDEIGNVIDTGDIVMASSLSEYTVLDADGVLHSKTNSIDYKMARSDGFDISTPLEDYPVNKTSRMVIFRGKIFADFPEAKNGILETYHVNPKHFSFQLYYVLENNNIYKRVWDSGENKWTEFTIMSNLQVSGINSYTASDTGPEYPINTVTYTRITTSNSTISDFPEGQQGVLITHNMITGGASFIYQEYQTYTGNLYHRGYVNGGWTSWGRMNTRISSSFSVNTSEVIPAGSAVNIPFSNESVGLNDTIIGSPRGGIETGLLYNIFTSLNGQFRIRLYNYTQSDITIDRNWNINILKDS